MLSIIIVIGLLVLIVKLFRKFSMVSEIKFESTFFTTFFSFDVFSKREKCYEEKITDFKTREHSVTHSQSLGNKLLPIFLSLEIF